MAPAEKRALTTPDLVLLSLLVERIINLGGHLPAPGLLFARQAGLFGIDPRHRKR